jgi:uncharacterized protein
MRRRDETILVLDRLPDDAKPHASSDCTKANSPAEKTLCSSIQRAAFDRSVGWAYSVARFDDKDSPEDLVPLAKSQRDWLRKRDACGTNASCLLDAMKKRIEDLSSQYP